MSTSKKSESRKGRSGCPPKWKHGETCTIRIPKVFKSLILEIAKGIDEGEKSIIELDLNQKPYRVKNFKSIHQKRLDLSEVFIYEPGGHKCIRLEQLIPALQKHLDFRND